jgi:hypothetical protein
MIAAVMTMAINLTTTDDDNAIDNHYEELAHLLRWLKIDRFDRRAANRELAQVARKRVA